MQNHVLGEGALSRVHLAADGFAVKATRKSVLILLKQVDAAFREKEALQAVTHAAPSYVARLHCAVQDEEHLLLHIYAVLASPTTSLSLRQLQRSRAPSRCLPPDVVNRLSACVASALVHIHACHVAHRDVKAENIVLAADGTPVLVDFGCARFVEAESDDGGEGSCTSMVGTLACLAPEMLSRRGHGTGVDWWSAGCVVYEALVGAHPFAPDELTDGGSGCDHADLEAAQRAALSAQGTSGFTAPAEAAVGASAASALIHASLRIDARERSRLMRQWAADHSPEETGGEAAMAEAVRAALAPPIDVADASAPPAHHGAQMEAEASEERAWAEEERTALLERAEASWRRHSEEWQPRFASFGPLVRMDSADSARAEVSSTASATASTAPPPTAPLGQPTAALPQPAAASPPAAAPTPTPTEVPTPAPAPAAPPTATVAAAASGVTIVVKTDKEWIAHLQGIERKCFAKHEAMDVAKESKGRGVSLLSAAAISAPSQPVGFAVVQRSSLALHVQKLVVTPALRRKGVGTALLAHAVQLARTGRAQVCTLNVDEANAPARALYESMGFCVTARRDDYYRVGRHALVMELDLSDG